MTVMEYKNIKTGIFLSRPNRFISHVLIDGEDTVCHVKNTGRCRELLLPGAQVFLQDCQSATRKTRYDLIAVYKGQQLVNIDSQAPNQVAPEVFAKEFPTYSIIKPETVYGGSRFDFYLQKPQGPGMFVEVKGCTLEQDGIARFPDAPTERGVKHLQHLIQCTREGYEACILFVIQMRGITCFMPNDATHPQFGDALRAAQKAGVQVLAMDCDVFPNRLQIHGEIPVVL